MSEWNVDHLVWAWGIVHLHYIMKSTKVQTLGVYYRRQTHARTASGLALFVSVCTFFSHTKWTIYFSHTMQEAMYVTVSGNPFFNLRCR